MKNNRWFILIASLLLTTSSLYAQSNAPFPPKIQVVSIDPTTNDVSIKWDHNINVLFPVDYYTLHILEYPRTQVTPVNCQLGGTISFPGTAVTVPNSTTASCITPPGTTLGTIVGLAPQAFGLIATSTVPTANPSALSDYHFPSFLTVGIDSCSAQATLAWTRYKATDANLNEIDSYHKPFNKTIEYEVWGYEGNPPFNQAAAVRLSDRIKDTTFVSTVLSKNKNYFFFVKVFLPQSFYMSNDEVSYSNRATAMYTGLAVPAYINIPKVEAKDDAVELNFLIDPSSELTTYCIERTTDVAQGFSIIYEFPDRTLTTYTDYDINPDEQYFYRISAIRCDMFVQRSDISSTIILSSQFQPNDSHIEWLPFVKPGSDYSVVRIVPDNATVISNLANTDYIDNVHALIQQGYDKFCYQITGVAPNGDISISRPSCFTVEPPVHMPDAIDPTQVIVNATSGAQRNRFGPVIDMNATAYGYKLKVFNRWGVLLYETQKAIGVAPTVDNYWDGTYKNKLVEPGLYLYTITIYFPSSQKSLKGDISVFY